MALIRVIDKHPTHDLNADEIARLLRFARGAGQWRRLNTTEAVDVTLCHDGTAITLVAYSHYEQDRPIPTEILVRAVLEANERARERRSKAAQTRAERRALKVDRIVRYWIEHGALAPARHCRVCSRLLIDSESIGRGIGSECWQDILKALAAARAKALAESA